MQSSEMENKIPEKVIHAVGTAFLTIGVFLLAIAFLNALKVEVNDGNLVGIGIVSGIFGAVLLSEKYISRKLSLIGTVLFYSIAIAGAIIGVYNVDIMGYLIWIVLVSSVVAMFFTLTLAAKATINPQASNKSE